MEKWWMLDPHALILAAMLFQINGQANPDGYLNIDCGLAKGGSYWDNATNLTYISDEGFVETGEIYNISESYVEPLQDKKYLNLRSFPSGNRNCYNLPTSPSSRYLLRAGFLYGNYDGKNDTNIIFDLYIGVTRWKQVDIVSNETHYELITLAANSFTALCLMNTASGVPFISFIEMRQLKPTMYVSASSSASFNLNRRVYMAPITYPFIRYPEDAYDRIWEPWYDTSRGWTHINTTKKVTNPPDDIFEVPSPVLQNAASNLTILYLSQLPAQGYIFCHFAELDQNVSFGERSFYTYINNDRLLDLKRKPNDFYTPSYLVAGTLYTLTAYPPSFAVTLTKKNNSQLYDPLINAMELYTVVQHRDVATFAKDFDAINGIMRWYSVKRDWRGDPCFPENYTWNGVDCKYKVGSTETSATATIISLNLSSSGLNGSISGNFSGLGSIETLDLANNNLTGTAPDFLAYMTSLTYLDLTSNCLQSVPATLRQRVTAGKLTLRFEPQKPGCEVPDNPKKSIKIIIGIVVPSAVFVAILLGLIIYVLNQRLKASRIASHIVIEWGDMSHTNRFSKSELENIINTFDKHLGGGGFGEVYYGKLEDGSEVAIKVLSNTSTQGYREFKKEVEALSSVYHRNIVNFIGFCEEGEYLALVYEFMPNGSLADHLNINANQQSEISKAIPSTQIGHFNLPKNTTPLLEETVNGNTTLPDPVVSSFQASTSTNSGQQSCENSMVLSSVPSTLTWRQKLKIAHGAAQGLQYLHTGLSMVHMDVKSANILLDKNFEAKVADFGMSRIFTGVTITMTQSSICGTFGYLDPEILTGLTKQLSFLSDVYSFGVVLLEMVTGQPPYAPGRGSIHIVDYVSQNVENPSIIDSKIGEYDPESMRVLINLAMKCTQRNSNDRPTMSDVVIELQQCLDVGMSTNWDHLSQYNTTDKSGTTSKTILSPGFSHSDDQSI